MNRLKFRKWQHGCKRKKLSSGATAWVRRVWNASKESCRSPLEVLLRKPTPNDDDIPEVAFVILASSSGVTE